VSGAVEVAKVKAEGLTIEFAFIQRLIHAVLAGQYQVVGEPKGGRALAIPYVSTGMASVHFDGLGTSTPTISFGTGSITGIDARGLEQTGTVAT